MSIFPNAQNFQVLGGEFHSHQNYSATGIDILLEASTPEAAVESEEVYKHTCCPGTREQYITDITNWATSLESEVEPIFWMKGPAGVGKTSIATTCAQNLKVSGYLGAAFFFSISGRRNDHIRFFPSLAYQLSTTLSDYRDVLSDKLLHDRTIVKMAMPAQFRALIVEPLQELERQGKPVGARTIFVDGLDECRNKDAQAEIIEIIAASVRAKSTPLRWAVFSREEPHIVATFHDVSISPLCWFVHLPVSRELDGEIELYLRNGFYHVLRRRNLLDLAKTWPTDGDIRKLVDAAAGLFAYPATVLRFVDRHSYLGFKDALQIVFDATAKLSKRQKTSPFAELDALYMLIMQRIPKDILPSAQLLLSQLTMGRFGTRPVTVVCNQVGISATVFRGLYNHLHAVVAVANRAKSDADTDRFAMDIHSTITFYHKTFHDFLVNPARSAHFCTTTPTICEMLFNCIVEQQLSFASGYVIRNLELAFAPGAAAPSDLLSWPQGIESVDSSLRISAFYYVSDDLSHDQPRLRLFLKDVSTGSLRKLAELDYRKYLIAKIMASGDGVWRGVSIIGLYEAGTSATIENSNFIRLDNYKAFDASAFLGMVERLEKLGVIKEFHPRIPSTLASVYNPFSRRQKRGRNYAHYEVGHGDKSVVWYWEFDTEKQYFHEFRTVNYVNAMNLYRTRKFGIWS